MSAAEQDDALNRQQIEILCAEVTRRADTAYAVLKELEQVRDEVARFPPLQQRAHTAALMRACVRYLSLFACRCRYCGDQARETAGGE